MATMGMATMGGTTMRSTEQAGRAVVDLASVERQLEERRQRREDVIHALEVARARRRRPRTS